MNDQDQRGIAILLGIILLVIIGLQVLPTFTLILILIFFAVMLVL